MTNQTITDVITELHFALTQAERAERTVISDAYMVAVCGVAHSVARAMLRTCRHYTPALQDLCDRATALRRARM